jgi:uncharacterized protein DUF6064
MSEWWTYTISDFLMYSARTYYRMVERYNSAVWPGHLLAVAAGLAVLGLLWRPGARQGRVVSGVMAVAWAWVAWGFLARRYGTINWAASYFAWGFGVEALLFGWVGLVRGRLRFGVWRDVAGVVGIVLFGLALLVYPVISLVVGRSLGQADVFGVEPDPTAVGTLGLLLMVRSGARWVLLPVPVLWCMFSSAMLLAMRSPETWLLLSAALLAVVASVLARTARSAA